MRPIIYMDLFKNNLTKNLSLKNISVTIVTIVTNELQMDTKTNKPTIIRVVPTD